MKRTLDNWKDGAVRVDKEWRDSVVARLLALPVKGK